VPDGRRRADTQAPKPGSAVEAKLNSALAGRLRRRPAGGAAAKRARAVFESLELLQLAALGLLEDLLPGPRPSTRSRRSPRTADERLPEVLAGARSAGVLVQRDGFGRARAPGQRARAAPA